MRPTSNTPGWVNRRFSSAANYILFDGGPAGKKGKDMVAFAQARGIIIRPESAKYGSDGWFRVTIGSKEVNQMFIDCVKEFFSK